MTFDQLRREIHFKAVQNFTAQDYQIMGHQVFKTDFKSRDDAPEYLLWNHRRNHVWLVRNPANGWLFPIALSSDGQVKRAHFSGYCIFSDDDGILQPMELNRRR